MFQIKSEATAYNRQRGKNSVPRGRTVVGGGAVGTCARGRAWVVGLTELLFR